MDKKLLNKIGVICENKVSSKSSKMIELYDLGLELSEIFEVMNERGVYVSRSNFVYNVISEYCRLNDVELRVKKKSGVKKEEIEKLLLEGNCVIEVCKMLKIKSNRVYKIRKEMEVKGLMKDIVLK